MSDTIAKFNPKISDQELVKGELRFILSGDNEYGLDKSLVNAIRRVLLTDIPTVGFQIHETGENNDIHMVTNNSSLHNEMLLHRIALIPLYFNPENYMKNHLLECKVKHDSENPFQFVTMNDVTIYPLKSGFLERLDHLHDESYDISPEDEKILRQQLSEVTIDNYDLNKPLSQKEKDKIVRPYRFREGIHYSLITELKTTNTEDTYQEIHFYGSPSVGYGRENARFQSVSQATYSYEIDESLLESVLSEKILVEKIESDKVEDFTRKFRLSESERYYHRDNESHPNRYNFAIKSNHYYDSDELFKKAIVILIGQCENLKLEFIELLKENESRVSIEQIKDYVYHYVIEKESHTLGNLIQSHIMRRSITDESLLNICGYKKPHPLEDKILVIVSINPSHKLAKIEEVKKIQNINTFMLECIDEIINDLRILRKVSEKSF